jgi:serine/threonine protein kinase
LGRELEVAPSTEMHSRPLPGLLTGLLARLAEAPAADDFTTGPSPGDQLGRFRLEREIGRGGFGRVFRATDLELGREVALKVIRTDGRGATPPSEWMRREAEAAAQLRHRNIVTLHDAGRCEGGAYLVYELLRGETLAERLLRGRLTRREAGRILTEVAAALAHAHAAGVVHRDVKPGNIFLEADGGVKLLDLGLAQLTGAIGLAAGSPRFMAPEQGEGLVDARADVYAWGRLGGLLLDGDLPPDPQPQPVSRSPATLHGLTVVARAHDPALRPRDGGALVEALGRFERGRRRLRLAGAALLGVGLAILLALPGILRPAAPPPPPPLVALADLLQPAEEPALERLDATLGQVLAATAGLAVAERSRLTGVLRASGKRPVSSLDHASASFAAQQVGAAAVLLPSARHEAEGVVLTLEARAPGTGELILAAEELLPVHEGGPEAAVSRLVARIAERLVARQREPHAGEAALGRTVTASLEAHRHYTTGLRCEEAPSRGESWSRLDCTRHFEAALAFDPEFPMARFALARRAVLDGTPSEVLRASLRPALDRLDQVPPRERAQLLAWKASLDGRPEEAIDILRRAEADWTGDARLAFALGKALADAGWLAEAVDPLERSFALDPGLEVAAEELAWTLGRLDRPEALRRLAARLAAMPPYPGTLHAQIQALGWTGDVEGALQVARRAAGGGGGAAREDLVNALVAAGRIDEAEPLLRAVGRSSGSFGERQLARLHYLAGRRREALLVFDRPLPPDAGIEARFVEGLRRAWRLAATRDGDAIGRIAEELRDGSLEEAASLAPVMAYCGAIGPALELAPSMKGQPGTARLLRALVTWRRDGAAAALPELRWAAAGQGLAVNIILPHEAPAWMAAECALEAGPPEQALADLRRFQRTYRPLGPWRIWAYPRSLLLEARLLDQLGRRAEASAALARLERLWARADPDLPLLAEVRALRRRLGPDGVAAAPAATRRPEP